MAKPIPHSPKEKSLYAPLRKYFSDKKGCSKTWSCGEGPSIRLTVPGFHRTPDVVGGFKDGSIWRTHLVEAKLLKAGHSFDEALSQLQSLKAWSDYLWLALSAVDWSEQNAPAKAHMSKQLKQHGFGLLLVSNKGVEQAVSAVENSEVASDKRVELLEALGIENEGHVGAYALSPNVTESAIKAVAVTAWFLEQCREVAVAICPTADRASLKIDFHFAETGSHFLIAGFACEEIYVDGDPFGYYLSDGQPAIWVWKPIAAVDARVAMDTDSYDGWFLYGDDGPRYRLQLIDDVVDLRDWRDAENLHLARRLQLTRRTVSGIRTEFARILRKAKSIRQSELQALKTKRR